MMQFCSAAIARPPHTHPLPPAAPPPQADGKLVWTERRAGSFLRSFALPPDGVDSNGISASVKDGVITVTIPKVPTPPKPAAQEIPIDG